MQEKILTRGISDSFLLDYFSRENGTYELEQEAFESGNPTSKYIHILLGFMEKQHFEALTYSTERGFDAGACKKDREDTANSGLEDLPACPICGKKPHVAHWLVEGESYTFGRYLTEAGIEAAVLRYGCSCYDHSGDGDQALYHRNKYCPSWVKLARKEDIAAARAFWEETVVKRTEEIIFQKKKKRWMPIAEAFAEAFEKLLTKQKR